MKNPIRSQPRAARKRIRRLSGGGRAVFMFGVFAVATAGILAFSRPNERAEVKEPLRVASTDDTISVPLPARSIAKGERLSATEIHKVPWPKSKLTGRYATTLDEVVDRFASETLPAALPIPLAALSLLPPDANAVVERIPEGMRAITVKVDAESAVEGWARAGNFVDVILIRPAREGSGVLESLVIAERVRILSAGSSALPLEAQESAPRAPATATLLVTQNDALRVKTAASIGKLAFALRGQTDQLPATSRIVHQRELLSSEPIRDSKIVGRAKSPDGKLYLLKPDEDWMQSEEIAP